MADLPDLPPGTGIPIYSIGSGRFSDSVMRAIADAPEMATRTFTSVADALAHLDEIPDGHDFLVLYPTT